MLRPLFVLLSIFLIAACGDSAADGTGDEPSCEGSGVTIGGVVREFALGVERQRFDDLEGVEVCVHENPDVACALTNSAGFYGLCDVPANSDLILSFQKEGYVRALRMLATRNEDYDLLAETVLGSVTVGVEQAEVFGFDLNNISGGAIQFFAASPGDGVLQVALLGGYSVELRNTDGSEAECEFDGEAMPCQPVYLDADGLLDPQATSASRVGVGAIGNVPAGDYDLVYTHPELECDGKLPESGWATEVQSAIRVQVTNEWVTAQVGMFCQPPE